MTTSTKGAFCFLALLPGWLFGGTLPGTLADGLMQQQRYREAELEYERLAYERKGQPGERWAVEQALAAASATEDASFLLKVSRSWKGRPELRCTPEIYESHALYRLENRNDVLKGTLPSTCPVEIRDEQIYLEGLSLMRLDRGPEAAQRFRGLSDSSALKLKAENAAMAAARPPHLKKPSTAALLNAAIPGMGYAYAGRPQTAAAALVVTGLTAWGAYEAADSGQLGLSALAALVSFGWYMGGVYGGGTAAEHENARRKTAWIGPFELHR